MNSLPTNSVLEFPPETIDVIRKMYDLDKFGQMDEAINLLDDWIKKQNHFINKEFSREYLERAIIACKGSVERAKSNIDKNCTLRTLLPKFYKGYNSKDELKNIISGFNISLLPKYAEEYCRVFFAKMAINTEPLMIQNFLRYVVIVWEYMKKHDYVNGVVVVCDFRDVNVVEFVKNINIMELHQAGTLVLEGIGLRVRGIYLLSSSKTIELFVTVLKQVVPAKIKRRIFVYKSPETLYEVVEKDILPAEYGGNENSIQELHDKFMDELTTTEFIDYMKEVKNHVTDESLRQADEFNDQYLGMPGTFKSLRVD